MLHWIGTHWLLSSAGIGLVALIVFAPAVAAAIGRWLIGTEIGRYLLLAAIVVFAGKYAWDARFSAGRAAGLAESRAAELAEELQSARNVIAVERKRAADMAKLADQYEQDKRNAQADQDRLAADLRAGNVRLRSLWQGCEVTSRLSAASGGSGDPDAASTDRGESAARIVRAARDADDQIRRLQEVIRKDREATK